MVFTTKAIVNGKRNSVMIDSGAGGNFILKDFVQRNRIATRKKEEGYEIVAIDGTSLLDVDRMSF